MSTHEISTDYWSPKCFWYYIVFSVKSFYEKCEYLLELFLHVLICHWGEIRLVQIQVTVYCAYIILCLHSSRHTQYHEFCWRFLGEWSWKSQISLVIFGRIGLIIISCNFFVKTEQMFLLEGVEKINLALWGNMVNLNKFGMV